MKAKFLNRNRPKKGAAPGTLQAPANALAPTLYYFAYDQDRIEEGALGAPDEIQAKLKSWPMVWVNVNGLGDTGVMARLGEIFNLHPLALEDVLNLTQRPKFEDYGTHFFFVCRMVKEEDGDPSLEQLSLFCGPGFVLSFQERPGDVLEGVRERLRKGSPRIRMSQADYLAYALIDAVIDGYFPVLEMYSDRLDAMEEEILGEPNENSMAAIHTTKRELQILRSFVWPLREALSKMMMPELATVREETRVFLRDCQDHVMQILDLLDNCRERMSSLTDLYLSYVSNRMNEVMKILTIIATIFMPLGFLAGIYGMNFDTRSPYNLPELGFRYGYPVLLGVMACLAAGMLFYFKRLGWLERDK